MVENIYLTNCRLLAFFEVNSLTPFFMRVDCFLQTRVSLFSRSKNFYLSKGVKMYSDEITEPLVLFLVEEYEKSEKCCLLGDIASLYKRKQEILEKYSSEMTYREYLQKKYSKNKN